MACYLFYFLRNQPFIIILYSLILSVLLISSSYAEISNRGLLWSLLVIAVEELDVKEIEKLLNQGANPNAHAANGYTALHVMASVGDTRIASLLIQRGANMDSVALFGVAPIHIAARYDEHKIVKMLAQAGAKIDLTDEHRQTPLHTAVFYDNMK